MFDFGERHLGIVPSSGNYGTEWPANYVIPQGKQGSMSVGGWTIGNEGFPQQTFLGASIRNFSISAGFGDSVSNISIDLVNDEYNISDQLFYGSGDDPYHDGKNDLFRPPGVGSPVFFKFGKNPADVEQAWRKTFDDTYGIETLFNIPPFPEYKVEKPIETLQPFNFVDLERSTDDEFLVVDKSSLLNANNPWRGANHLVFGGILQGYTENQSNGGTLYNVNVVDPREILSDCVLLFNNYQGTTFNNKNLFNVYGFLEYDPTTELSDYLDANAVDKAYLSKIINQDGSVSYRGNGNVVDQYEMLSVENPFAPSVTSVVPAYKNRFGLKMAKYFPITGQGLSRRTDRGIPFYRISQALASMFEYYGGLPKEYIEAGFGGKINFRGFNYVVDFGGIPIEKIPYMYFLDYDQLDILSFAQELCDIISHDLFVSLLPIIDHPACAFLENFNQQMALTNQNNEMIAGIIRLDAIDRSIQPSYGSVVEYLSQLKDQGVEIENQDVGFELSNIPTDKFVVGAQEVEMYFFDTGNDRDDLQVRREDRGQVALEILQRDQWLIETSEKQQVIPFYGFIGDNKAVSIPRGWGAYQQILIDTTSLNAFGVGNYYIATELELRAALVSFESWKDFLLKYNDTYIQDTSEYNVVFSALSEKNDQINDVLDEFAGKTGIDEDTLLGSGIINQLKNREFAVHVPRCVWDSDRPFMGSDNLPASPCSPPFGYPLYYKRATKIGIPEAGIVKITNAKAKVITNAAKLKDKLEGAGDFTSVSSESLDQKAKLLIGRMTALREDWIQSHPEDIEGWQDDETYQGYLAQYEKLQNAAEEYEEIKNKLIDEGEELISETQNTLEGIAENPMFQILPFIAKQHLENAKKVYEFVKRIAEDNLGKRFLVKIPKACNTRYQPNIVTYDKNFREKHIAAGPFGFPPQAPGSGVDSMLGQDFALKIKSISDGISRNDIFKPYLNYKIDVVDGLREKTSTLGFQNNKYDDKYYTYGALKNNYNPIDDKWDFNYKPEPQGGFINYALYPYKINESERRASGVANSDMPLSITQGLLPADPQKLTDGKNRIGCYVRFDNSHLLNFNNIPVDSITQQTIASNGKDFIPDIVENLPNLKPDQQYSFSLEQDRKDKDKQESRQAPSVAFVKCEVDETLYMPPKLEIKSKQVFAREYELRVSTPPLDIKETKDEDGCPSFEFVINRIDPVFSIPSGGGTDGTSTPHSDFVRTFDPNLKGNIINASTQNQDSDHVYALITVPGRIVTNLDQRWADGPQQTTNTLEFKNLMTQDVVKIPEFSKPSFPDLSTTSGVIDCEEDELEFSIGELTEVERIRRQSLKGIKFNVGETTLQYIQPSPIYPNMVAIPLLSWEKCYGPWMSAAKLNKENRVRYSNIGGKIEFLKDENLAPWNFGGYQLMDEAGRLQAEFSNSLLLISERGAFVYPAAPSGISLGKALKAGGPLVTSINVQIGESIRTTVQLDLYTNSFGKLQKQKEGNIATIVRERQKLLDQNNNAVRRGLGKSQTNADLLGGVLKNGGQKLIDLTRKQDTFFEDIDKKPAEKLLIASDGRQTNIAEEKRIIQGVESYNNFAQALNELSPGGGVLPVVDLGDVFEVVNTEFITSTQNGIPGRDSYKESLNNAITRRFFGNAQEGDQ